MSKLFMINKLLDRCESIMEDPDLEDIYYTLMDKTYFQVLELYNDQA